MKILSAIVLSLISIQANAGLNCAFDGTLGGIQSTEIVVSRGGQISAATVIKDRSGNSATVWSLSSGSLDDANIKIWSDLKIGIGTLVYAVEKSDSGYDLVESFHCDHINGEERCNVEQTPVETARKKASCQLN